MDARVVEGLKNRQYAVLKSSRGSKHEAESFAA